MTNKKDDEELNKEYVEFYTKIYETFNKHLNNIFNQKE